MMFLTKFLIGFRWGVLQFKRRETARCLSSGVNRIKLYLTCLVITSNTEAMRTPRFFVTLLFCILTLAWQAQDVNPADSTGLPGDNFSLQGALDLFKKAETPEAFEKSL